MKKLIVRTLLSAPLQKSAKHIKAQRRVAELQITIADNLNNIHK
jgi:hypothetical protein